MSNKFSCAVQANISRPKPLSRVPHPLPGRHGYTVHAMCHHDQRMSAQAALNAELVLRFFIRPEHPRRATFIQLGRACRNARHANQATGVSASFSLPRSQFLVRIGGRKKASGLVDFDMRAVRSASNNLQSLGGFHSRKSANPTITSND